DPAWDRSQPIAYYLRNRRAGGRPHRETRLTVADPVGFTFTETMGGFVGRDEQDFRRGSVRGRRAGERFRFKLTIFADDLGAFLSDPAHEARMRGTVDSTSLGQGREVRNAVFNLLERDPAGRRWMKYR